MFPDVFMNVSSMSYKTRSIYRKSQKTCLNTSWKILINKFADKIYLKE